jgi:hypothetical protein
MAADKIMPLLKEIGEQVDRLEIALTQLDAANLAAAESADLAAIHSAAVHNAAKLAKAASELLLLCGRIDTARKDFTSH